MAITSIAVFLVIYKDSHYSKQPITGPTSNTITRVGSGNILLTDNANLVAAAMRHHDSK